MLILKKLGLSLLLSIAGGLLSFFICYQLAILISPPSVYDPFTRETHPVMPIGHVLVASVIAAVDGILICLLTYKRYTKIMAIFGPKIN